MTKQWRSNGEAQELLDRLFAEGLIEEWETAANVQARDPIFKQYSERVFSNHFRTTKMRFGLGGIPTLRQNDAGNIPELGLGAPNRPNQPSSVSTSNEEPVHPLFHNKAPCWTWVFTDHDKKKGFRMCRHSSSVRKKLEVHYFGRWDADCDHV